MKKLIMMLSLVAVSAATMATPAKRGVWKTVALADGSTVRVELRGDENLNYWQAADGQRYVRQEGTQYFVEADMEQLQLNAAKKREAAPLPTRKRKLSIGGDHDDFVGEKKGLIILAEFTDVKFQSGHDAEYYTHVANGIGFTSDDGHVGSIRDYFLAQSYGLFDLTFDVVGPIQMSNKCSYYGGNSSLTTDVNVREMIKEAVVGAAEQLGDFSDYDWFGDGRVDQVFVIYAGEGEANGGGDDTIWPHRSSIPTKTLGGKKVSTYACSCELRSASQVDGIGPFCHEFSHCLGLADLYDTSYGGNYGMSAWDLMNSGCYLGNSFRPCGYSGYERNYCGWKKPVYLDADTTVTGMKGIEDGGDYYVIKNDNYPDEYYILENRTKTGWDSELCGEGLLITYIDFNQQIWSSNEVNTVGGSRDNDHQRYTLFVADNSTESEYTDVGNDAYPYRRNNLFTNYSVPAQTLYHENTDGKKYMSKPVTNITRADDGTISFDFANEVGKEADPLPSGVFFRETFDHCNGDGGNDDIWRVVNSNLSALMPDNEEWTFSSGNGANQCALIGTSNGSGSAVTPTISISEESNLTFRAAAASIAGKEMTATVVSGSVTLGESTFQLTRNAFGEYSTTVTAPSYPATFKLQFDVSRRFYLDDVSVASVNASAIKAVGANSDKAAMSRIYTIDGRYVGDNAATLRPGLYLKGGRKLVVK